LNCAKAGRDKRDLTIRAPCLLLVEGQDEVAVLCALLNNRIASPCSEHQVMGVGGRDQFRRQLGALTNQIREARVRALGVVRDADENAADALRSVCDALAAAGLARPDSHAEFVAAVPRVGVFVMPDGQNPGALEALCRRSIEDSPAGSCVDQYLDCLRDRGGWGSDINPAQEDKAFAHAYLASRKNPVARVGEGAQQGAWDFEHSAFRPLGEFLRQLVGTPSGDASSSQE